MTVEVKIASGRARCKICKELIEKNTITVHFTEGGGFNSVSAHHHLECIEQKIKVLKGDDIQ